MKERRIEILDGFRFLAIISVMFFHYTYRWTFSFFDNNLYPYGTFFKETFKYGNKGVQFFFIISGFVISYSLENTENLSAFFKNRLVRLLPPMILWSAIIYLTSKILDNKVLFPQSHELLNFLPSVTFISPEIWSTVFPNTHLDWLNPSYWTLWIEVRFYLIAGLIFFMNKEKFLRNILLVSLVMTLVHYILVHFSNRSASGITSWQRIDNLFSSGSGICYFTLGVVFYYLFARKSIKPLSFSGISITVLFFYQLHACLTTQARIIFLVMIFLFLLMIFKKDRLRFLETPIIRRIGVISYSVYLSHEIIGVLLINKYGGYLGKWSPLSVPVMMIFMICLSGISYRFVERRMGCMLRSYLFKSKPVPG